ncbi:GNAT family N-acetyltransferase, partial [Streptomyces sp. SID11233]|nr:GNAT family N-acetyltransferase [Streptomyces sp. SID11233]
MSETSGRASGGYQGRIRTAQPEDLPE